jgi:hypothetical protein
MTRPYFRVYGPNTATKPKWKRTPMVVRGALLTLWMTGSMKAREGYWRSREELEEELESEGCPKVKEVVDRLIELKWVDCTPEGCTAHDWLEWQAAMKAPSNSPVAVRARVAAHRARKKGVTTHVTGGNDVTSIGEERREETTDGSLRSPSAPVVSSARRSPRQKVHGWLTDHKVAIPVGYVNANLNELIKLVGPYKVIEALEADTASKTVKQFVAALELELSPPTSTRQGRAPKGHTRPASEIEHAFEH